ncbi:MAG: hypothetical protein ACMG6E_05360, partial [Candidatus Roizmanbacteria bacterium]
METGRVFRPFEENQVPSPVVLAPEEWLKIPRNQGLIHDFLTESFPLRSLKYPASDEATSAMRF